MEKNILTFDIKNKDILVWKGQIVMSRTEEPYFTKLFVAIAKKINPQRVLEIGYGLGISGRLIEEYLNPSIHDIVEIDESIYRDLEIFSASHPGVRPIVGDWRTIGLKECYDFIFFDPFDYFNEGRTRDSDEARLLHKLLNPNGHLCHPHFGDGNPREIPGFCTEIIEEFKVPPITMADGSYCDCAAAVLCHPVVL